MSNKANPTQIGAFIVGAIILMILGVIIFSSDSWFNKNERYIVFFSESINGLNIGAPVKLSGVQIGHVTSISVERDIELNKILVPVIFEVNPQKISNYYDLRQNKWKEEDIQKMIESGLRMQLQLSSLLTGQLFIEARFLPNTPAKIYGHRKDLIEIPSVMSSSNELQNTLRRILEDIKSVDIKKFLHNIDQIVTNVEQITGSEQTRNTLAAINATAMDLEVIMGTLKKDSGLITRDLRNTIHKADLLLTTMNANAGPLLADTRKTVATANTVLVELQAALANIQTLTNQDSAFSQDLQDALKELARAARSTRVMMDYLERHPDALIYGKGKQAGVR